mmetsp:Transcript_49929/g.99095  ORF Transcript_49929/g.99095 Transcript_49929/m.99095 type:complete len:340 (-) Transcript_49929:11-1030(-)
MAFASVLGHLANLGQVVALGQGHAYQREQVNQSRRNYTLDLQALKVDLLGTARDDVRSTYETYMERLDTLLLLNGLLLTFSLNTLQYSDIFLPDGESCHNCIPFVFPWTTSIWTYLVAASLILPFWSLMLLLWCKAELDNWLHQTLDWLQQLRRCLFRQLAPTAQTGGSTGSATVESNGSGPEEAVVTLGGFIVHYQDLFMDLWNRRCAPLVLWATRLLWLSVFVSVALVAGTFWVFLADREGEQHSAHLHFLWVVLLGILLPAGCSVYEWCREWRPSSTAARGSALRSCMRVSQTSPELETVTRRQSHALHPAVNELVQPLAARSPHLCLSERRPSDG